MSPRRTVPSKASTIVRVRVDLTWQDVLRGYSNDQVFWNAASKMYATYPAGFWNHENIKNFAVDFAKSRKMDPLLPDTWYSSAYEFRQTKRGRVILRKFHNSFSRMLQMLFPKMLFDSFMLHDPKWHKIENRRYFFEEFAAKNGFDPQVAGNWYSLSRESIVMVQKASILRYHNNSITRALLDLFPNINLDANRLRSSLQMHYPVQQSLANSLWFCDTGRRRAFFEKYAVVHQFDSKIAENWYLQSKATIMLQKHVMKVIVHHNNSLSRALVDLFPSIGLDLNILRIRQSKWRLPDNRRKFFENFAVSQQFDPLDPSLWYLQSETTFAQTKGASYVLFYHEKSFTKALLDLFPEIGLDSEAFYFHQSHWHRKETRRYFFEMYARQSHFDPLLAAGWYSQLEDNILQAKEAREVVSYHRGDLSTALMDLFPEIRLDKELLGVCLSNNYRKWTRHKSRKDFFEKYAIEAGFNSKDPTNWYSQSQEKLMTLKGIHAILYYHGHSLTRALLELFPGIGLEKSVLHNALMWKNSSKSQRDFFELFAKAHDFDPLVSQNWYLQSEDKIIRFHKGARTIIGYHNNSIATALLHLFPEIGLERVTLQNRLVMNNQKWSNTKRRKEFFDNYARDNHFSPLDPANWYLQSTEQLKSVKEITEVLHYHENDITLALLDLFPNIGLNRSRLLHTHLWNSIENRINYFTSFAKENKFDPLVPENWYSVSRDTLLSRKDITEVLHYHNNNLASALVDLFPQIGLVKSKLQVTLSPWKEPVIRREYFEEYARTHGFDHLVPENWYSQPPRTIKIQFAKAFNDGVLLHHNQSVPRALVELFPDISFNLDTLLRMKCMDTDSA